MLHPSLKTLRPVVAACRKPVPSFPDLRFAEPPEWTIREGEQWAVVGPNGAGKTLIADILQGRYPLKEGEVVLANEGNPDFIKSIAFKDVYSLADYRNAYYQQRWHSTETDNTPLVADLFDGCTDAQHLTHLLDHFAIRDLLPKRLLFLSSGELRKFLIVRTLLARPRLLILDNPFIGLDAASRLALLEMLQQMTQLQGLQLVLLLSDSADVPPMITHILPLHNKTAPPPRLSRYESPDDPLPAEDAPRPHYQTALRMENVSVRYGNRAILRNVNWEVKNGEKWALLGANGSGKSTLLSLVCADHPQAYANSIYLFDRKRGSGESIWEIKQRIGYVSPEMHLYYRENVPAWAIVGSGFFDSIGLYCRCNDAQRSIALQWMATLGIAHLRERPFLSLSSGEQRLTLLARAFVKHPDLLVLDEPMHGLDAANKQKVAHIIERFSSLPNKTLIYVTHYPHELPASINNRFVLPHSQK
jgi:molybdate transport system ATP-binding protein